MNASTNFPALNIPQNSYQPFSGMINDLNTSQLPNGGNAASKTGGGRESSVVGYLKQPAGLSGLNNISTTNILGGITPNDSMMMTNTLRNGGPNMVHKNNPSGLDIINSGG